MFKKAKYLTMIAIFTLSFLTNSMPAMAATNQLVRNITFHRNPPKDTNQQDETINLQLAGDKAIFGVSPFDGHPSMKAERDKMAHDAYIYYYFWDQYPNLANPTMNRSKYADTNTAKWMGIGGGLDFLFGRPFYRTFAWNTKPDGTGTYYRLGYPLPANAPEKLDLYLMWVSPAEMTSFVGEVKKVKPVIYLEENNELNASKPNIHTSIGPSTKQVNGKTINTEAYNVDQSMNLHYKATLNFENIRDSLRVLWGRTDKIRSWKGYLKAVFDSRLEFDRDVEIAFESTRQKIDPTRQQELGATSVRQNGNKTTITFSADRLKQMKNANGEYEVNIPITLIDPKAFAELSFEDFMKPMWLSVADNFSRGINAVITEESYNKISTSDNPVIKVGGQINLEITGDIGGFGGTQTYSNGDPKADDVYARLFPTGSLDVDFYTMDEKEQLTAPIDKDGNKADNKVWHYQGRSKHSKYADNDYRNYSDSFLMMDAKNKTIPDLTKGNIKKPVEISHPEIPGYTFVKLKEDEGFGTYNYKENKKRRLLYLKNSSIIVDHITNDGKKVSNTEYRTGKIGEKYNTKDKGIVKIDGKEYEYMMLSDSSDLPVGQFGDHVKHITYIYKPKTEVAEEKGKIINKINDILSPLTGVVKNNPNALLVLLPIGISLLISGILFARAKRK